MKKKTLKKMLAIALAAMTVSATPGLVGAMSEASQQKIKSIEQKLEGNVMDEVDVTQSLNELETIAQEDDEGKVEVSKILGDMIDKGLFGGIDNNKNVSKVHYNDIPKIIEILEKLCFVSFPSTIKYLSAIFLRARAVFSLAPS